MGTSHPDTLGKKIIGLAKAVPILTAYDTSTAAGEYLTVIFPLLTTVQREQIEDVIFSLPQKHTKDESRVSREASQPTARLPAH